MYYKCTYCVIRSFEKLLEKHPVKEADKENITRKFLEYIANVDYNTSAPRASRDLHAMIRKALNDNDPYKQEKVKINDYLLSKYDEFKQIVEKSGNRFDTALRLAIAGNIIDFGPSQNFDVDGTIKRVLSSPIAIDQSKELEKRITKAEKILYLADNAGEIVLDKLFIETINHPNLIVAVRESPVINDVTLEEASYVGIDKLCRVITNGYDAPSTLLEKASKTFLKEYNEADLIISKGMGNFEGLMNIEDQRIFFVFMVKCQYIGDMVGAMNGDFVVKQN